MRRITSQPATRATRRRGGEGARAAAPTAAAVPAVVEPDAGPSLITSPEDDAYRYGWRFQAAADDSGDTEMVPLRYADLLDPQPGDVVAEDTIHRRLCTDLQSMLERSYTDDPTVAVWSNLKVVFLILGLTTGPGPDLIVVRGVRDRDRLRTSFHLGKEPGKVLLAVEMVSQNSQRKDYEDLVDIYGRMGIEEYLAIRPRGFYIEGPYDLKAWRRDPATGILEPLAPVATGRVYLPASGLLFVTGGDGWGLGVWDAATGKRLLTSDEEASWQSQRAAQAESELCREVRARRDAEERAAREAEARREAEERAAGEAATRREEAEARHKAELRAAKEAEARCKAEEARERMMAEIERLRVRSGDTSSAAK